LYAVSLTDTKVGIEAREDEGQTAYNVERYTPYLRISPAGG